MKRMLIYILALQPLFIIALLTYYQYGLKKYGDPVEYGKQQQEIMRAIQDSIQAQVAVFSPENVGDSTMVGLDMHTRIFEEADGYERRMTDVKTALDSLQRERLALESL